MEKGDRLIFLNLPPFSVVHSVFSIFLLQDIMRFNPTKEHLSRLKLKSKAVVHGHRTFPAIYCPGDPFDPKR
jgi:hypothetical protein